MKFESEVRDDIVKREKLLRANFENIKKVIEGLFDKGSKGVFVKYNGYIIEVSGKSKNVAIRHKKIPLVYSYYFSNGKLKNNGEIQLNKFARDLSYYLYMNTDYSFSLNGQIIRIKNDKDGIYE